MGNDAERKKSKQSSDASHNKTCGDRRTRSTGFISITGPPHDCGKEQDEAISHPVIITQIKNPFINSQIVSLSAKKVFFFSSWRCVRP